jgi:flagellar hook assembly protein FlgD
MMTTRFQQYQDDNTAVRRRATSKGLNFGPIATAITIGTVAVLLGVTFIGDWLRVPSITAGVSPSIISPNGDGAQDSTSFSYSLNEDAHVTVEVFNPNGSLIQTVVANEFQTRGQHVALWNGRDNLGQAAADGPYRLQVTAQGTVMAGTQNAHVVVDTVPPALHLANLNNGARVREANLTIEGLTDPNAVVQIAGEPTTIPVDGEGSFNIKRQLLEGSNSIQIAATDPAGNVAELSREVILVTQPPELTIAAPADGQWTNEKLIRVAGTAPPGTLLKINGQEATVAEAGGFEHEVILQEGDNTLKVEVTDDVGNASSQEIIIHRKTTAPSLSLSVDEGEIFQQAEVQILGKTEPSTSLLVNGQAVNVNALGEFQTTVSLLQGENMLEFVAQDQAGNVTQLQRRLNFDVTAPESEWARVMRNLPTLSTYFVPVLLSLPILLILAYLLTRPVALVLSAESSAFRPGLPEEGRFLKLGLDLSKPARTTVEIRDPRGNTVATLLHRRHRGAGQQPLYWNGYDDFGQVVKPGEYTIQATASTPGGTVTGNVNISILEDKAVHRRRYLRETPHEEEAQTVGGSKYVRIPRPARQ